jgi:hypothetical protein
MEKKRQWRRDNYKENPEKHKEYARKRDLAIKMLAIEHYGGHCICCGESQPEFLTFDHIENNGAEHRRSGIGRIYRWLKTNNFPSGYQLLCWNCNCARHHFGGENKMCPHNVAINEILNLEIA